MVFDAWISAVVGAACVFLAHSSPSPEDLQVMKKKWDECCKTNVCIRNSCYTMEEKASGWASVRQRCQGQYPDWPYLVDLFRVQNPNDIAMLSKLLLRPPRHPKDNSNKPIAVWTSGTRCPRTGSNGPVLVTRWTSSKEPFPEWLESKIAETAPEKTGKDDVCKFLILSFNPQNSEVKYDFQDQVLRHSGICEFVFPGDVEDSGSDEATEFFSSEDIDEPTSTLTSISAMYSKESSSTFRSETLQAAETIKNSSKFTTSSEFKLSTATSKSTWAEKADISTTMSTIGFTSSIGTHKGFCKGQTVAGIQWPDAEAGTTVNKSCPEGLTGYADWKCSAKTLKYTPEKPHIQDCKHAWIGDLEKEVAAGNDAVHISRTLSQQTKVKDLSHGDITALVDLSSKILHLYSKQVDDQGNIHEDVVAEQLKPVSYNFTDSMVSSMSNILRAEIKTAWETLPEIHQTRAASKILKLVTTMGSRLSCLRNSHDRLQFTVASENIDLQTFILNGMPSPKEDDLLVFPQQHPSVHAGSSIVLPAGLELNTWSSSCQRYKTAVGVIYNHVGDFLKDENLSLSDTHVVTKVISFSVNNDTASTTLPEGQEVTVTLQHLLQHDIKKGLLRNPRCMFWNFSKQTYGQWDTSGCHFVSSNTTHTVCSCDHLTNFAVLMDINRNIEEDVIQSMMTYVCCGISSFALLITLICFFAVRSLHGRRSIITGNLCFCLLMTNLFVIFGLDQTQNEIGCAVIAGLLQFWILSAFFWMLVEGYHLYKMVVLVFQRGNAIAMKLYYIFAYGCPLLVVIISASIRSNEYGGEDYCWLSSNHGVMWSFVGPACTVILVNIVVFILTLRSASNVRIKKEQTTVTKIKSWARGSMSVMCLLGLTWCLGLFYINRKLHMFSYIFTLLNGLQGVFIFIFHILLNEKVKSCLIKLRRSNRSRWQQTFSNRFHSKTSTRTSLNSNGCGSTRVTSSNPVQQPNQRNNLSRSSTDSNGAKQENGRKCSVNYRNSIANHAVRGSSIQPLSASVLKTRSQSYPEETIAVTQRSNLHASRLDGFHVCITNSAGRRDYFK